MFIGHLPAGFLLGRALRSRCHIARLRGLELLGALLPDADLFYWAFDRHTFHHHYWTHQPIFWVAISLAWALLAQATRSPALRDAGLLVLPNVFGHLLLDSIVGRIEWLYPWSTHGYAAFQVTPPPGCPPWLALVTHWTFGLELALVAAALLAWRRDRAPSPNAVPDDAAHLGRA